MDENESPTASEPGGDDRPAVISVSRDHEHRFSKQTVPSIRFVAGFGIEGDAHAGATTQHRHLAARDPSAPNLTQVHLLPSEVFDDLRALGYRVVPGELGENVTTVGVNLVDLPRGALLHLGDDAVVQVTGLRNPCSQINRYQKGLMRELIDTDAAGRVSRRAGVMGIVVRGGTVFPGDRVRVERPAGDQHPLGVV